MKVNVLSMAGNRYVVHVSRHATVLDVVLYVFKLENLSYAPARVLADETHVDDDAILSKFAKAGTQLIVIPYGERQIFPDNCECDIMELENFTNVDDGWWNQYY